MASIFTAWRVLFLFSLAVSVQVGKAGDAEDQNTFRWIQKEIRDAQSPLEALQKEILPKYFNSAKGDGYNCDACKLIVGLLQEFVKGRRTEAEIAKLSKDVCIILKIEDKNVCTGIIPEFKDEVLYVVDNLAFSPDEVCGLLYGDACATVYNPYVNWTVSVPGNKPPVVPPKPPKVLAKLIWLRSFLHYPMMPLNELTCTVWDHTVPWVVRL